MKGACFLFPLMLAAIPAAAQESAPDADRLYELAEVESLPRPANAAELVAALQAGYPAELRAGGVEGTVQVSMIVGVDGTVSQPSVVRSTHAGFDSATVAAVGMLRFEPARVGGRPVRARVELPVQWRLAAPAPAEAAAAAAPAPAPPPAHSGRGLIRRVPPTAQAPEALGAGEYELRHVEVRPRPLNLDAFRRVLERNYPPAMRGSRTEGTVEVRFRVTEDGATDRITIVRSTEPGFNEATIESVRDLRFSPALLDGRPVKVWVILPIQWSVSQVFGSHNGLRWDAPFSGPSRDTPWQ